MEMDFESLPKMKMNDVRTNMTDVTGSHTPPLSFPCMLHGKSSQKALHFLLCKQRSSLCNKKYKFNV